MNIENECHAELWISDIMISEVPSLDIRLLNSIIHFSDYFCRFWRLGRHIAKTNLVFLQLNSVCGFMVHWRMINSISTAWKTRMWISYLVNHHAWFRKRCFKIYKNTLVCTTQLKSVFLKNDARVCNVHNFELLNW